MLLRDLMHEVAEVGRTQSGVSAVLVDLVGSRLDQDEAAGLPRLQDGGLDDERMCGTNGRDAEGLTGLLVVDDFIQRASRDAPLPSSQGIVTGPSGLLA
ncbi:hypothetical protein HEB94_005157 [Actinopolymorpha pittospori]|uniref:Uncharacterized protein n=1 Tax=Actinopolymorpha pittospori TaxID=648752 RepID=A0A927MXU9_9ACTN|nr:hypothetical protein [Actinopolymorpha pittospori]